VVCGLIRTVDGNGSLGFSDNFKLLAGVGINREFIVTGTRDFSVRTWELSSAIQLSVLLAHL